MTRAWVLLLAAACGEREQQKPNEPPLEKLEELDRLPPKPPAPRQTQSIDQVLECFSDPIRVSVPNHISSITPGDFDGDGKTDAIVTYETLSDQIFTGHVVTYRNTGDGRLVEHASIKAGDMIYAVSVGHIDNDGALDLAVNDPRAKRARLYAGKGDGTFVEKPALSSSKKIYSPTLVDLDGDQKLDLVAEHFSDVSIYKGDGAFGFKRTQTIDTGQAPDGPAIGDFDGDNLLDLGYVANDEGFFFTLTGRPFRATKLAQTGCNDPAYTSSADFDDDGDIDIGYVCPNHIEMRLNDGKGAFRSMTITNGHSDTPIIAADLTNDGKTDLLLNHRSGDFTSRLTLLAGDGKGDWNELTYGQVSTINALRVADFDGDGKLDIVAATWDGTAANLLVLLAHDCAP